jgi:hypothetical protein
MTDSVSLMQALAASADVWRQAQRARAPAPIPDAVPRHLLSKQRPAACLPMRNNSGAPAPPLVLLKRVTTPDHKEGRMKLDDLLKSAVYNLDQGNMNAAERLLDQCEQRLQKASVVHNHYYRGDDDEAVDDTWSQAADSNAEGNNASLDDDDDDDDDDDFNKIRKASDLHPVMGGSKPLPEPQAFATSGGHKADPYSLGSTPAVRAARPHKFDSLVQTIMERDSCSKNAAMSTARQEHPDAYQSYQSFVAGSPTNEQATRRAGRGVGKRMPMDYESLVSNEMLTKGVSWRTAETRIINQYGSTAFNDTNRMIKRAGSSIEAEFTHRANEIMDATGCERTEALRALRLQKRYLYDALNSV